MKTVGNRRSSSEKAQACGWIAFPRLRRWIELALSVVHALATSHAGPFFHIAQFGHAQADELFVPVDQLMPGDTAGDAPTRTASAVSASNQWLSVFWLVITRATALSRMVLMAT